MKQFGSKGEDLAAEFLKAQGYRIIERNYKTPIGELDIIAKDGETLVFVEVKTRSSNAFGYPFEAVDARKKHKLKNLALFYMKALKKNCAARFDVISINLTGSEKEIEHIKDAFEA
ncbi:MAG: YraN family protein [Nitrospiraceae bacterium]|nr:MAG: YraN family protein [Nitrospiraceae bacterium]